MAEIEKGKRFALADSVSYVENGIVSKQILKKKTGNISVFAFDKGEGLSEHTTPFDALVQALDGSAEILIGGEIQLLHSGECIILPSKIPHAVRAVSRFKMLLTMIKSD